MAHNSRFSERLNAPTQMKMISEFLNLPLDNVEIKKGRVQADFQTLEGDKIKSISNVIYHYYKGYPANFNLHKIKKCDFIAKNNDGKYIYIEAKQNGTVFFEALGVSKNFSRYMPDIKKYSKEEGVEPLDLNNKAVENFVNIDSKKYIQKFLEDRIRTPDYILLASEKRIISFEKFLEEYEIYAEASNHRHEEYKMAGFFFRKKY